MWLAAHPRSDGRLFHIDFGYILGQDPKPFPPPMKLCREMVEAMGGQGSDYYNQVRIKAWKVLIPWSDSDRDPMSPQHQAKTGLRVQAVTYALSSSRTPQTPVPMPLQFRMYAAEAYNILRGSADLILSLFHLMAGAPIEAIRADPEKAILKLQVCVFADLYVVCQLNAVVC